MQNTLIEKEILGDISFFSGEVLSSPDEQANRMKILTKAMVLGNGEHGKVKITFKTKKEELLTVHTTVWAVADKFVNVKANRTIPVSSILKVEI